MHFLHCVALFWFIYFLLVGTVHLAPPCYVAEGIADDGSIAYRKVSRWVFLSLEGKRDELVSCISDFWMEAAFSFAKEVDLMVF